MAFFSVPAAGRKREAAEAAEVAEEGEICQKAVCRVRPGIRHSASGTGLRVGLAAVFALWPRRSMREQH